MKDINIPADVVAKYKHSEVLSFVTKNIKRCNRYVDENGVSQIKDRELQFYIDILDKLNEKMGGVSAPSVL